MFARSYKQDTVTRREFYSNFKKGINYFKGKISEFTTNKILRLFLPRSAVVLSSVVLKVSPYSTIEIDHIVLSRSGIYLIEEKNWRGIYYCGPDMWYIKTGHNMFRPVKSPVVQHERHYRLFIKWLVKNGFGEFANFVKPVLFLNKMNIFHTEYITMSFYRFPFLFLIDFYDEYFTQKERLPEEIITRIVGKITTS